jgi:hypothetical protein
MMDNYDYQQAGVSLAAPKYTKDKAEPMPSREELLARNSFGSPDDNKYLNGPRKATIAAKQRELDLLKGARK